MLSVLAGLAVVSTAACGAHSAAESAGARAVSPVADAPEGAATPIADPYREVAGVIVAAALADGDAYDKLAYLTDHIGPRLSGSTGLERAIEWAARTLEADGHEDVRTQKVMVPHWVRGHESAEIVSPAAHTLHILGLGGTVGTGPEGISGEVIVVEGFEDFERLGERVKDRIVLYNKVMAQGEGGYGEVARYRMAGPSVAARHGARAVLVRSLTARSLRSPHTGALVYDPEAPSIPAAAIATEDAELIARLAARGEPVVVRLTLGAQTLPDAESANVIAELRGHERPEEIVLLAAHIDSWDVGQGAHDNGTGTVTMMQALTLLRRLELRPRRTIRVVLFTNEENGRRGSRAYEHELGDEITRHVMALEADSGGFAPQGVRVQAADEVLARMSDIVTLLEPIDAARARPGFAGVDVSGLVRAGVPALGLWVDGSSYFDIHHSHADTLDKVDPDELARGVAVVAVIAYVVADMPGRLDD